MKSISCLMKPNYNEYGIKDYKQNILKNSNKHGNSMINIVLYDIGKNKRCNIQ